MLLNFDLDVFLVHAQICLNAVLNSELIFVFGVSDKQFAELNGSIKIVVLSIDLEVLSFNYIMRDLGVMILTSILSKFNVAYKSGRFMVLDLDSAVVVSQPGIINIFFSDLVLSDLPIDILVVGDINAVLDVIEDAFDDISYFGTKLIVKTEVVDFRDFVVTKECHLAYTNVGDRPIVGVFDQKHDVVAGDGNIILDLDNNCLLIQMGSDISVLFTVDFMVTLMGVNVDVEVLNGCSFWIIGIFLSGIEIEIAMSGIGLLESDISIDGSGYFIVSEWFFDVEVYFEGAALEVVGLVMSFNNQWLIVCEMDVACHAYTDADLNGDFSLNIFGIFNGNVIGLDAISIVLGLDFFLIVAMAWVDELNVPIKVAYDVVMQSVVFNVDHMILGFGGVIGNLFVIQVLFSSNFGVNAFGLVGTLFLRVEITSATSVCGQPFVFDGASQVDGLMRFGVKVNYDREACAFIFESGTIGEVIVQDKAVGVLMAQKALNIQVGWYVIDLMMKSVKIESGAVDLALCVLVLGENDLMGVGGSKSVSFVVGKGL